MGTLGGVSVANGAGKPLPGTMLPFGNVRAVKSRATGWFEESNNSAQA
jgi:hypothetical protein